MGQIVIDIPSNKKRRFVIKDAEQAELLISALETAVVRVKTNPTKKMTRQQLEDFRDGVSADRVLRNNRRSYSQAEIEKMLGI